MGPSRTDSEDGIKGAKLNKYSQSCEEELIGEALKFVDAAFPNGMLVEFGGSTGKDNSNLFVFGEQGRELVLIESNPTRFKKLAQEITPHSTIKGILAEVGFASSAIGSTEIAAKQAGLLSEILRSHDVACELVSVVSIDIDGDDAAVFENLGFLPEMAIVEFNPTLGVDSIYRNPPGHNVGNSPGELIRVAANLGMYAFGATGTNLLFLRKSYLDKIPQIDVQEALRKYDLPRFGLGYDGTLVRFFSNGENTTQEVYHNGWNDSFVRQPLPKFLRKFSKSGRRSRVGYFLWTGLFAAPIGTVKFLLQALFRK